MRLSLHSLGYLLLLFIGVAVWWPQLAQQGMYNDGLWYAAIARNLSEGMGGWWHPQLSTTFGDFVPHPPLVFWLEGGLFALLGDHLWVERLYSLLVSVATVFAIRWLWRTTVRGAAKRWWWLVVALWSVNEVVYNYYPNNLLDCTMALFALLSVGLLLRPVTWRNTAGAGLFLILALLAKGPVGLFPLAVPMLRYGCFFGAADAKVNWTRALLQTMALAGMLAVFLGLLWQFSPGFREFLQAYYDIQIRGGLAGEQAYHARKNRFYILGKLVMLLLPLGILTGLVWALHTRRLTVSPNYRKASLWAFIGLAASVPLALSPKQTYYYLLAAMPYFYLAAGTLMLPSLVRLVFPGKTPKYAVLGLVLATLIASTFTYDSHQRIRGRHQEILPDLQQILPQVPPGSTMRSDEHHHTLVGYLARLRRVSVDTSRLATSPYFIGRHPAAVPTGYHEVPLETRAYRLYRKAN